MPDRDLAMTDGDLPSRATWLSGAELALQRVRRRLRLHRGECPTDRGAGVPWGGILSAQPPLSDEAISALLLQQLRLVPGVIAATVTTGSVTARALPVAAVVTFSDASVEELSGLLPILLPARPPASRRAR